MHADADVRKIRGYDAGMRTILVMAALAIGACGGSDDPKPDGQITAHDELACDTASWSPAPVGASCERACVTKPAYDAGSNHCTATTPSQPGVQVVCEQGTFTVDGVQGCCKAASDPDPTLFYECQ
jgi:hypothetical protein